MTVSLSPDSGFSKDLNARFGTFFCEILKKPRTKRLFWKLCSMKFGVVKFRGSLARNDHFGTFLCENCRKPRAVVLEPSFVGSLARNDHFGSFFLYGVVLE